MKFGPLSKPLPDPESKGKRECIAELAGQQVADVLHGRIVEKIIERLVIVVAEDSTQVQFHLIEIQDHAVGPGLSFNDHLNLIGMAVELAALGVPRQKVRAVDMICDAELHWDTR